MDYEKKYKEALERAKEFQKSKDGLCVLTAESIFPELCESEDERALRIIKKRMCYDPVPISDEDRRIVENWLEKQKEQKPSEDLDVRKQIEELANDWHHKGFASDEDSCEYYEEEEV